MIIQEPSTDILQLVTGSAGTIQCLTSWVDNNSGVMTPGGGNFSITTATTTNISAAPASGNYRALQFAFVRNAGASQTITLQHTDGTTVVPLWSGTLKAGRSLMLNELGQVILLDENNVPLGGNSNALVSANWSLNSYTNATWTTVASGPAELEAITIANNSPSQYVNVELDIYDGSAETAEILPPLQMAPGGTPIVIDLVKLRLTSGQSLRFRADASGAHVFASGMA